MDKIGTAVDQAKQLVPGVAIAEKVRDKAQQITNKVAGVAAQKFLESKGVDPKTAAALSRALTRSVEARQNEGRYYKAQKDNERRAREAQRAGDKKGAGKAKGNAKKAKEGLSKNRKQHKENMKEFKNSRKESQGNTENN